MKEITKRNCCRWSRRFLSYGCILIPRPQRHSLGDVAGRKDFLGVDWVFKQSCLCLSLLLAIFPAVISYQGWYWLPATAKLWIKAMAVRKAPGRLFSVFMWPHRGHIGVQNNSEKSLLGIWFYYYAKLERHFAIVLYTNKAVSSREWKPRIGTKYDYQTDTKSTCVACGYDCVTSENLTKLTGFFLLKLDKNHP